MRFWDTNLGARALRAYFRSGAIDQPGECASGVEEHNGKTYVVLRNIRGTLKVYRVADDGRLKALRRWPKALEHW